MLHSPATRITPRGCSWATGAPSSSEPDVRAGHPRQAAAIRGGRPARACAHSEPGIATCANIPPEPCAARLSGVRNRPRLRERARRPFCALKHAALSVPIWMCRRAMLRAPATRTTPRGCSWATGAPSSSEPDVRAGHLRQAAAARGGRPARAVRARHARQAAETRGGRPARACAHGTSRPGRGNSWRKARQSRARKTCAPDSDNSWRKARPRVRAQRTRDRHLCQHPARTARRQALRRQEPSPAAGAGAPTVLCAEARRTVGPHMDVPQGDAPRSGPRSYPRQAARQPASYPAAPALQMPPPGSFLPLSFSTRPQATPPRGRNRVSRAGSTPFPPEPAAKFVQGTVFACPLSPAPGIAVI